MAIRTLLAVWIAVCLQDTSVFGVVLEASNPYTRSEWGANEILLVCRDGDHEVINAIFTRNGDSISASNKTDCLPGGATYCAEEGGSRLRFIASSVTEGRYACKDITNVTSNEIAIIGKCVTVLVFFYQVLIPLAILISSIQLTQTKFSIKRD